MGQAQQKSATHRPIVLILGGGYGGVTLAKLLDESGRCFVLLVDAKEFFLHTVATPRILARKNFAHRCLIPYDKLLKNGVVIHGVISRVTPQAVFLHGRPAPLTFDFLVLATGAKYTFPFQLQPNQTIAQPESLEEPTEAEGEGGTAVAPALTPTAPIPQPLFYLDALSRLSAVYDAIASPHVRRVLIVGGGCVGAEVAGEILAQWGPSGAASAGAEAAATTPAAQAKDRDTDTDGDAVPTLTLAEHTKQAKAKAAAAAAAATSSTAAATPAPSTGTSAPSASSPPGTKSLTLLHSGPHLLNRQSGLRDRMRQGVLAQIKSMGGVVHLGQRAQLELVREVRGEGDGNASGGAETARSGELGKLLLEQGYLVAAPGCSLVVTTVPTVAPAEPTDASKASASSSTASTPAVAAPSPQTHFVDFILLATGTRPAPELFQSDPEIRSCLDSRGRLLVNRFFQLEGRVTPERAAESIARSVAEGQVDYSAHTISGRSGPGVDSDLHARLSFHYPHILALGDCCVPKDEAGLHLNPQAYLAHRHAQAVARNIVNMIGGWALKPYEGSGPQSVFLSLGPRGGWTQLPNRGQSLSGDSVTRMLKSEDMHVAANWAFLNQDPHRPSFRGHASMGFVEERAVGGKQQQQYTEATTQATAAQGHASGEQAQPREQQEQQQDETKGASQPSVTVDSDAAAPSSSSYPTHGVPVPTAHPTPDPASAASLPLVIPSPSPSPSPSSAYAISSLSLRSSLDAQAARAEAKMAALERERAAAAEEERKRELQAQQESEAAAAAVESTVVTAPSPPAPQGSPSVNGSTDMQNVSISPGTPVLSGVAAADATLSSSPAAPPATFRPAGTEGLSVAVAKPAAASSPSAPARAPSSSTVDFFAAPLAPSPSPSASSPIGPILLPGAQEDRFAEAMAAEEDDAELPTQVEQDQDQSQGEEPATASDASTGVRVNGAPVNAQQQGKASLAHGHADVDVHLRSFAMSNPFGDALAVDHSFAPSAAVAPASGDATTVPAGVAEQLPPELGVGAEAASILRPLQAEKYNGMGFLHQRPPEQEEEGEDEY